MRVLRAGERGLLVELGAMEDVHRVWSALRADPPAGAEDVVAGATTVLVLFGSAGQRRAAEDDVRSRAGRPGPEAAPKRLVTVPVAYDGPDLEGLAALTGLTPEEVVRVHSEAVYTVAFLGFSPGFAYLAGAHPALHVPRLAEPRTAVPAGSVAVAAGMSAIYPQPTPGGWHLIGRSDVAMFDPTGPDPTLFRPGDQVRFQAVEAVGPAPSAAPGADHPEMLPGGPYLQVLDAGPLTTVQDLGRPGWAHLGVPRAGAADRSAAVSANRLVGNPPGSAVLEATLAGPRLRAGAALTVAVTGARADVRVDGLPARQDAPLRLSAGAELMVGPFRAGTRAYIAVSGGIAVAPLLGSRSADTLSGLGPAPVRPSARLPVAPATDRESGGLPEARPGPAGRPAWPGDAGDPPVEIVVTAHPGPRDDWITAAGLQTLRRSSFRVAPSSDRTGVRLSGPPVATRRAQLPSEGMVPGAVQIPPDGQPIVLLRNHPTTGGYPVAAVVVEADVDRLAQARPGAAVRFDLIPPPD